jgi:hypothetical protein
LGLIKSWNLEPKFIRLEQWLHSVPINFFLEILLYSSSCAVELSIEVAHPNHDELIITTSCKVVSFLIEVNSSYLSFVSEHSPTEATLLELPDLYLVIAGN